MNTATYLLGTGHDEAPMLIDGDAVRTYGDLRAAVQVQRMRLEACGLASGDSVVLVAPNGFFWIVGYLATMAAGLVSVPLPTALTSEEIAARVGWVGARAALLGSTEQRRLDALLDGIPVLGEDVDKADLGDPPMAIADGARRKLDETDPAWADRDAAYLFTSGTTGTPRAVRITHRNIQANTASILAYAGIERTDRMLVVLPFSYVFGASLLHTHLRAGACLVNQPTFVYLEAVVERVAAQRCTSIAGVPSTFHALMRNSTFASRTLPDLRLIQQAGGRMSPPVIAELRAAHPQARLLVMYGQTEATARLSYLPPEELDQRPASIGRGIPGVQLRVIGEDGTDVAPGEVGEIWASGDNISPGYLHDELRTAEKMPNGVLRTGDLATVDEDGFVYVVDRAEDFIKSWGHRIASQDVESVVMELIETVSVAAVGVPHPMAGEVVAVCVVVRPGVALDAETVRAHCRARLAKHMVPEVVAFTDALPLNSSGKVIKRAVRERLAAQESGMPR